MNYPTPNVRMPQYYCIVLYCIVLYCIVLYCIAFLGSGNPLRVPTAVILSNKGAHLGVGKTSEAGKRPHKWITRPRMCVRPNIIALCCIVLRCIVLHCIFGVG